MKNFRETITSILDQHGKSIDSEFYLDAVMDLSIERRGEELIVCQYYLQRGDLM